MRHEACNSFLVCRVCVCATDQGICHILMTDVYAVCVCVLRVSICFAAGHLFIANIWKMSMSR